MLFTDQELAEMAAADAEIEASFCLDKDDLERSSRLDRLAKLESLSPEKRKVAEYQKAYREANRENAYETDQVAEKIVRGRMAV